MAIENTTAGITITGPDIDTYRLLVIQRGLKLQAETGMRLTGRASTIAAAQALGLTERRTAAAAYRDVDDFCMSIGLKSLGPVNKRR